MKVVYSPLHLRHDPPTETMLGRPIQAKEQAERGERIREALASDPSFAFVEPTAHGDEPILAVHDADLVHFLDESWAALLRDEPDHDSLVPDTFSVRGLFEGMSDDVVREPRNVSGRSGHWALDSATPIVEGTMVAARAAVDVALTAVDLVLDGGETQVYGLCRPPGHHAARSLYGGYCYFNNAAIAAEAIASRIDEPVAILDVDFHHGNGTQQIFWRRGDVLYVSLHGDPDRHYPFFLGRAHEVGEGEGLGANLNLPLPAQTDDAAYLEALDRGLEAIAATEGSIVVVSLGMDTFRLDPLGDFSLTTEGYHAMGERVAALGRRLVILQEGGYHRPLLGENVRAWLRGAEGGQHLASETDRV